MPLNRTLRATLEKRGLLVVLTATGRAYGLFQYDIQLFKVDPDGFLNRSWRVFENTLEKAVPELEVKTRPVGLPSSVRSGRCNAGFLRDFHPASGQARLTLGCFTQKSCAIDPG